MAYPMNQTPIAAWRALVTEATQQAGHQCDDYVEHYLVLTLAHFTTDNHLSSAVIALDFLLALDTMGREGGGQLRRVGDECLLLAGLFPERAAHKHVPVDYFVHIGQYAYRLLTQAHFKMLYDSELFAKLSHEFPTLIHILQTMRKIPKKPLQ